MTEEMVTVADPRARAEVAELFADVPIWRV